MPGDGYESTNGNTLDFETACDIVRAEGYAIVSPRLNPDDRMAEEMRAILAAVDRMQGAHDCGGSLNPAIHPRCVEYVKRKLDRMLLDMMTPAEAQAAE